MIWIQGPSYGHALTRCPSCPGYGWISWQDDGEQAAIEAMGEACLFELTGYHSGDPPKFPPVENYCRVYWGSHGCHLERGHRGHHTCDCCDCLDHPDDDSGCVATYPYYGIWGTRFYGEDRPWWHALKWKFWDVGHWYRLKRAGQ